MTSVNLKTLTGENCNIPGYSNKKHIETQKKISTLEKSIHEKRDILLRNVNFYTDQEKTQMLDSIDTLDKEVKVLQEKINSGEFDIDIGYNEEPYQSSAIGYSIGNNNGRIYIGRKCDRIPLDPYNENYTATEYIDGVIPETNFTNLLRILNINENDSIMFDSDIFFGPGLKDDDRENVEKAISHAHEIGMINAENKKAFEILRSAKAPLTISANSLNFDINKNLSVKGKKNAIIIVNSHGFDMLDGVDSNGGYPLVKRIGDKFIYRDKYEIQEVDNHILPNNEDGTTPIIIGDMSIVKFFVMREDSLIKDEFTEFKIHDRKLKREIIALTTTSDSAYIHGTIS